jgi:hypothetical protein
MLLGKGPVTDASNPNIIDAVRTGLPSRLEWMQTWHAVLEEAGVTGDVALAILAHWAHETGFGAGEWNYNVGNIGAFSPKVLQHPLPQAGGPAAGNPTHFRAYRSLAEGAASYLALLRGSLYAGCYGILQASPLTDSWVRCLGQHGYYKPPNGMTLTTHIEHYAAAYRRVLAEIRKTLAPEPEQVA